MQIFNIQQNFTRNCNYCSALLQLICVLYKHTLHQCVEWWSFTSQSTFLFQVKCSFKWRRTRDSFSYETHWETEEAKTRWEDGDRGIRDEEKRVNDERRTSRRLRTTMSAHHVVFPSFSPSSCFITISPLLSCFSLYLFLVLFLTPPSLSRCMLISLLFTVTLLSTLLSVSTAVSLQLCSIALVLSINLSITYLIMAMYTAQYVFTQVLLSINF